MVLSGRAKNVRAVVKTSNVNELSQHPYLVIPVNERTRISFHVTARFTGKAPLRDIYTISPSSMPLPRYSDLPETAVPA
jgi:hypothetical protein